MPFGNCAEHHTQQRKGMVVFNMIHNKPKEGKTMKVRKATEEDLRKALELTNKEFDGNVIFNRLDFPTFTLKVKDSKGKGARRGDSGRRLINACWHVHGTFFDKLFEVNPDAYVISQGNKITASEGNWVDRNIGSMMNPLYYSEACECGGN